MVHEKSIDLKKQINFIQFKRNWVLIVIIEMQKNFYTKIEN